MQSERMVLKTYCKNLVVDEEFVAEAYDRWRRNEAGRKNAWRVDKQYGSAAALIAEITREANDGTLSFEPIETRPRNEDGKVRDIGVEPVKQQVCGYVVDLAIEELWNAKVGYWQISRPGFGQFRAAGSVKRWLGRCGYHVHLDIRKCYDNIKCRDVERLLAKYVKSASVVGAAGAITDSYPDGHLMIGSYFSLRMAQLVLSCGYHHVEGLGKVRRGKRRAMVAHQCWYVDDVWLFGDSKRDLKQAVRSLAGYMRKEFGLELKPWKICRSGDDEPADIAGVVVRPSRITVRDKTFLRARRALMRYRRKPRDIHLARRVLSYNGWLKHADCLGFMARSGAFSAVRLAKRMVSNEDRRAACPS